MQRASNWLLLIALFLAPVMVHAAPGVIRPGEPWLDNRGQRIQAHGGGITVWKGVYYWFGEDRTLRTILKTDMLPVTHRAI